MMLIPKEAISHGTLRKRYECTSTFLRWLYGLKKKEILEVFLDVQLPKPPELSGKIKQPTSSDIKKLFQSVLVDGKRMSVRNLAILKIIYDVGARCGEPASMRCSDLWLSKDGRYYCLHFPESKSKSRTVISYLAKDSIDQWLKVRPTGYDPESNDYLFCKEDGKSSISYASLAKAFDNALKKSGISWKKGKGMHYFRTLFSSRAANWGYIERYNWLGWRIKGSEQHYVEIPPEQYELPYFEMLKREKNALLSPEELGVVEKKEAIFVDKSQQENMLNALLEGRMQEIEEKMMQKLLARQRLKA